MLAHAKKLFAPPVFPDDEDRTRAARVLNTLVLSFLGVLGLALLLAVTVFAEPVLTSVFILAFAGTTVLTYLLLRLRHVRAASLVFVSVLWAILTAFIALAGGTSTAAASFYLACAVFAGLLLGTRAAVVVSVLSILAGSVMLLLEWSGSPLPRIFPVPPRAGLADIALGLIMIVIVLGITLDSIKDALASAQRELAERIRAEAESRQLIAELRQARETLQRRTEELEALREAAQVMGASLDVNEILRLILDQLRRVLVYDTASVVIFRERGVPDLVAGHGFADEAVISVVAGKLLQDSPILRQMSHDLKPIVSADVRQLDGWIWVPGAEHVRSWLGIPLVARDRMIGALMVDHSQERFFGAGELQIAQSLAQPAAQAIENARLYDETVRRNRELALLNRVIAASAAGQEIETVVETACRELARAFDLAYAVGVMFDRTRTQALVVAEYQRAGGVTLLGRRIPLEPGWPIDDAKGDTVPMLIDDAAADPRLEPLRDLIAAYDTVHLLILPLVTGEKTVGALAVAAAGNRSFTDAETSLAQRVADQVSGSLARNKLEDDQRGLEEQVRQVQKMEALGRLAGGIAHDFNNLISVIQLSSQMMERQLHPDDILRPYVTQIRETGERATRLVKQLLSFSRRDPAEPRVLQLQNVVSEVSPMLRRLIGEDVELTLSLARDLWSVEADPSQIEQVIVNLAVNARDAMPNGGKLSIEMANVVLDEGYASAHIDAQAGEHVLITVRDTGVGMDQDVREHIFEPFFTTKEAGKGTGLGLSTVFGIVTRSGGHIDVDSQVGLGTTIKIYLPRAVRAGGLQPSPHKQLAPKEPVRGTETILLVEDEALVRGQALQVLELYGYRILAATSGPHAVVLSREHNGPIHLLLTDVVMPHMSGVELARQLRAERPEIRVVFMSGYTSDAIAGRGVLSGEVAFLHKPFTVEMLTHKIRAVLDAKR